MNEKFSARIAEAYSIHSKQYASVLEPILRPMADEIVSMANLRGGERVLDIATGTGLIARAAAQFARSTIGIDISLGVLVRARSQSAVEIPYVTGDAHRLPFGDQRFDLVTCGLSLSHFSDVSLALGEIQRVLRSRGYFITSAWGGKGKSPTKAAAVEVRKRFLDDREETFGGTFNEETWADVDRGCAALKQAGFEDVQVITKELSGEYPNQTVAIETALAWPLTRYRIAELESLEQKRLMEETAAAIYEVDDLRWRSEVNYFLALHPGISV